MQEYSLINLAVYFIGVVKWVLCISTSFRVLAAPESWSKHFFQPFFNLFCSFQSFFRDFTAEINKKQTKKSKFVYSSKLVDMQKMVDSLRGYLKIVFFRLINYFFTGFPGLCLYIYMLTL